MFASISKMGILSVVIYVLCVYGCYKIAKKNRRNTTVAVILGLLFSLIALIVYLIIGKK